LNGQFVVDASMTLSWVFPAEATPFTNAVLKRLRNTHALAPALWPFEVMNALTAAERRGRISLGQQAEFLEQAHSLPVEIEQQPLLWLCQKILPLARRYGLTAYDATYLELAIREGLPLATLDDKLRQAAQAVGVPLVDTIA